MKTAFVDKADVQRLDRLRQCRILEEIMAECRRARKTKSKQEERAHLEDCPNGIRMLRYFDWRNVHDYDRKCSREQHAVWACRAGALQCGGDLVQLRTCFDEVQEPLPDNPNVKNHGAVLRCSASAYEAKPKHAGREIPCRTLQEQMGKCVAKNAAALVEREAARELAAKQLQKS